MWSEDHAARLDAMIILRIVNWVPAEQDEVMLIAARDEIARLREREAALVECVEFADGLSFDCASKREVEDWKERKRRVGIE